MSIPENIESRLEDPAALEQLYREALTSREEDAFAAGIEALYASQPASILLQAWHHRLTFEQVSAAARAGANWLLALLLSILNGLVWWGLSEGSTGTEIPLILHLWAPVAAVLVLVYFFRENPGNRRPALLFGTGLISVIGYILAAMRFEFPFADQYLLLAAIHIPFLSWAVLGLVLTSSRDAAAPAYRARFAFIRKSLEVFVTGGLYLGAGMIFGGITVGMFTALNVLLPGWTMRLIIAGGAGLLPIIAVVSVYDAKARPADQAFGQGVGRLVPILTTLLLPLSLVVLVVYAFFIPFNFFAPFESREVLIVYNAMLFAIVGMLLGATPIDEKDRAPFLRTWIRRAVIAVAALAALISVYALAAVVYRTVQGGWTPNRVTVIGWNLANIGILVSIVVTQLRLKTGSWADALQKVFGKAALAYLAWALGLMVLLPLVAQLF